MSTNSDFSKPISFQTFVYRVVFENNTTTSESTTAPPNYAAIAAFASASSKFYSSSFLPNIIEKDFGNGNGTKDPKLFEFFFGSTNLKQLLIDSTPSEDNIAPPPISTTLQFGRFLKLNADRFDEDLLLLLKSTPYFKRSLQKLTIYNPRTEHFMRSALEGMDRLDEINIEEIPKSNARVMSRAFKPLSTLPSLTSFSISSGFLPLNEDFFEAVGDLGTKKVGTPLRKIKMSCDIFYFNELNHNAFQNHFAGRLCAKKLLTHFSLKGISCLINADFDALIKAKMTSLQVLSLVGLGHDQAETTAPQESLSPNKIVEFVKSCSNEEFCELTLHNINGLNDGHLTDLFSFDSSQDSFRCCPTTLDVELARTTYDGPSFIENLTANYSEESATFFETLLFLRYRRRFFHSAGFVSALYKFDNLRELECSRLTNACFEAETTTEDNVTHKFLSGLTNLTKIVISEIENNNNDVNTLPEHVPLHLPVNFGSVDDKQAINPPFLHLDLRFDLQQEHLQQLVTGTESSASDSSSLTLNENNRIKSLRLQKVASDTPKYLAPLAKLPHLEGLVIPFSGARYFEEKNFISNFFAAREKEKKKWFDDVVVSIRYDVRRFTKHDFKFDSRSVLGR